MNRVENSATLDPRAPEIENRTDSRSAATSLPPPIRIGFWHRVVVAMGRWVDNSIGQEVLAADVGQRGIDWARILPFAGVHLACLAVIWVGWSWIAVGVAAAAYALRMFAVTAFYHRYFSHKTFKTSRPAQFGFALLAGTCAQRGPLWWAAHHRHHHQYSDRPEDPHSPIQYGLYWSQIGWILSRDSFATRFERVPDLAKYPELRFLNRFDIMVPFLFGALMFALGATLEALAPSLGTTGPQMLVWGFFISTVVLFHAVGTINSLAHLIGAKRYDTGDESRNSLLLALLTFGEGWHNNHHHYMSSTRQGFYWWEVDVTYYLLKAMSWTGIIWDLKPVPEHALNSRRVDVTRAA